MPPPKRSRLTRHTGFWNDFKGGFTLAEVLITLGIIGVVSALTIPNLIAKYQEKVHLTRLKKTASELTNAYNLAIAENSSVNTWSSGTSMTQHGQALNDVLSKYLKYVKVCEKYSKACASPAIHNRNGTKYWTTNPFDYYSNGAVKYFLADGSVIQIKAYVGDGYTSNWCKYPSNYSHYLYKCGEILVDTNGFKGPNRNGVDVFKFLIMQDKLLPLGAKDDHNIENFTACNGTSGYGEAFGTCTAWALYNENMDYLHCPDKLSWDGKHSCK